MELTMKSRLPIVFASLIIAVTSTNLLAESSKEITNAVTSNERAQSHSARDKNRKPAEILSLLGVKSGMKIADLTSGSGYYTDILSRVVGKEGQVIAHNPPYVINRFAGYFTDEKNGWPAQLKNKQWSTNVVSNTDELDTIKLPVQLDGALMVLFYHDTVWQGVNRQMMNQRIFNALKPGGVYLIVDHSAKSGTGIEDVDKLHRIEKQFVIDEITKAGFVLDVDSNLLAHPKDTRDYSFVRDQQTNRDQTDRMVLKFVKPIKVG